MNSFLFLCMKATCRLQLAVPLYSGASAGASGIQIPSVLGGWWIWRRHGVRLCVEPKRRQKALNPVVLLVNTSVARIPKELPPYNHITDLLMRGFAKSESLFILMFCLINEPSLSQYLCTASGSVRSFCIKIRLVREPVNLARPASKFPRFWVGGGFGGSPGN